MARRALLIANGSFRDEGIAPLQAPSHDARRFGELLAREDVGGFEIEYADNLESSELRRRILRFFRKSKTNDQTLVYFSGHGDKDRDGELYFNTHDTEPDALEATAVPARYVIRQAKFSLSKQTVFLIDCCYSGAFASSLGVKSSAQSLSKDDFDVEGSHGMAVITASAGLQPAREHVADDGAESLFTSHLINGIALGGADRDETGKITLANLLHYIREQLRAQGEVQEPRSFFFGLDGSEPIALNPALIRNPIPAEIVERCRADDWRERRLAVAELEVIAENNPSFVPDVIALLEVLKTDPDDRVKRPAKLHLAKIAHNANTPLPPPPSAPPPTKIKNPRQGLFANMDAFLLAQPEVRQSLRRGAKVEAIKAVRSASNWSLSDSKIWVEKQIPPSDSSKITKTTPTQGEIDYANPFDNPLGWAFAIVAISGLYFLASKIGFI